MPLTSAARSDFMTQSVVVLSIDVCRGLSLGISPLYVWLIFAQGDLGPRCSHELLFSGFVESLQLFLLREDLCSCRTVHKLYNGHISLKFNFFWEHRVSISIDRSQRLKVGRKQSRTLSSRTASMYEYTRILAV